MRRFLERIFASVDRQLSAAGTSNTSSFSCNDSVPNYEFGDEDPWDNGNAQANANFQSNNTFQYEQLDHDAAEIRALTLAPARDRRAPLLCHLARVSLPNNTNPMPVYEALSYDPTGQRVININRLSFPVTENLDVALRYLRKPYEPRVLWVDAVCIDQQNRLEKIHQVRMMKDIYREASQVLVWLGESDRDVRIAMDRIKQLETPGYLDPNKVATFYTPCEPGLDKIFFSKTLVV
ncbi:MAG: hypothetical protein Q9219_002515 [cf. Caloplaca sp. 3 TL-2023]